MYLLKMLLCFTFYYIFSQTENPILEPQLVLYTATGYLASFIGVIASILTKKLWLMRAIIAIDFVISLPARAYIGLVFAVVSIVLSFNKKISEYFAG